LIPDVRSVVFDFDGTLIDSHLDIAEALNLALADVGAPPREADEVKRMIGHGVFHLLAAALGTREESKIERARKSFAAHYKERLVVHTRLYPGALETIAALRTRGVRVGLATNKPAHFTREIVARLEIDRAGLEAWSAADEVPKRKPDPAVLALALERLGANDLPPASVLYVGDMPVDVETARAFGARSAGALWGFSPDALRAAGPDRLLERFADLLD
jgi:phosphoglycolate phosphatase